MGFEGGRKFESPEDFERRAREPLHERAADSRSDARQEQEASWLSELDVTAEAVERIRKYPIYEGASTEFIIYELVYAKLIEQSGEWTTAQKQRVRNLLGSMRLVGLPNMNDRERTMITDHAQRGFFSVAEYELTPTTVADVQAVWATFGLARPTAAGLPARLAEGFFPPQPAQIPS